MVSIEVSVVMSVYNCERYLAEAIDSILRQTFPSFEFIIIDDGSSDHSYKIIQGFRDPRIRSYRQKNMGLAVSLNRGIKLAKGKYIARMDSDDISHPDRLSIQHEYMVTHPWVDILGGHAYLIDDEGKNYGEKIKPITPNAIHRAIEYGSPVIHPTYMVKTCIYHELCGYRPAFFAAQDYDFLLRAHDAGKNIANINRHLLYYRKIFRQSRPAWDRYQILVSRLALKLHRQRVKCGSEDMAVLAQASDYPVKVTIKFDLANKWRTFLLHRAKRVKGINCKITMLLVIIVSLFDFELFCFSVRGFLYKRASTEK